MTKETKENKKRELRVKVGSSDHVVEDFTIKGVTIATEAPVARYYGEERIILTEDSVVLDDFAANGLNLLDSHDPSLRKLGTVKNPVVADGKVKADIVFDKNYEKAVELFTSVVEGDQRIDLSIGYEPIAFTSEKMGESYSESHTVTKVRIEEVSLVGDGADDLAGFGRSKSNIKEKDPGLSPMAKEAVNQSNNEEEVVMASPAPKVDMKAARSAVQEFYKLGRRFNITEDTVDGWLDEGISIEEARVRVLDNVEQRGREKTPIRYTDTASNEPAGSFRDGKLRYSMNQAVQAMVERSSRSKLSRESEFALEVSEALDQADPTNTVRPNQIRIPFSALQVRADAKPFMATGDTDTGENYITDEINMGMLKKYLFQETVTGKLGLQVERGLVNDLSVPRQKDTFKAQWVAEDSAAELRNITTETFSLTPKTLISATSITNLAKVQVPSAQSQLTEHLNRALMLEMDFATLLGKGSDGVPQGIINALSADQKNVKSGNNAARVMTLDDILDAFNKIRKARILDTPVIVAPDDVINFWRKEKDSQGQYLWTPNADSTTVNAMPGSIWGSPVYRTTNMRLTGDAAGDNRVLIGVFRHAMQAFWGNSFVMTFGETGSDFLSDKISIRMVAYADVGVSYPQAFQSFSKVTVTRKNA